MSKKKCLFFSMLAYFCSTWSLESSLRFGVWAGGKKDIFMTSSISTGGKKGCGLSSIDVEVGTAPVQGGLAQRSQNRESNTSPRGHVVRAEAESATWCNSNLMFVHSRNTSFNHPEGNAKRPC